MIPEQIDELLAKRDTPLKRRLREHFCLSVEAWVRGLEVTEEVLRALSDVMTGASALYAYQAGVSEDAFVAFATESYRLYVAVLPTIQAEAEKGTTESRKNFLRREIRRLEGIVADTAVLFMALGSEPPPKIALASLMALVEISKLRKELGEDSASDQGFRRSALVGLRPALDKVIAALEEQLTKEAPDAPGRDSLRERITEVKAFMEANR